MKQTIGRSKKVEGIVYIMFKGNLATRYRLSMEETVRQQYVFYQRENGHLGSGCTEHNLLSVSTTPG